MLEDEVNSIEGGTDCSGDEVESIILEIISINVEGGSIKAEISSIDVEVGLIKVGMGSTEAGIDPKMQNMRNLINIR